MARGSHYCAASKLRGQAEPVRQRRKAGLGWKGGRVERVLRSCALVPLKIDRPNETWCIRLSPPPLRPEAGSRTHRTGIRSRLPHPETRTARGISSPRSIVPATTFGAATATSWGDIESARFKDPLKRASGKGHRQIAEAYVLVACRVLGSRRGKLDRMGREHRMLDCLVKESPRFH